MPNTIAAMDLDLDETVIGEAGVQKVRQKWTLFDRPNR